MQRSFAVLALASLSSGACFAAVGCDDPEPESPPPTTTSQAAEPPPVPTLDELPAASAGRATLAQPSWDANRARFTHRVHTPKASYARVDNVAQVLLGEDSESGVMLTYYGERLSPGNYDVVPATDESRQTHAGTNARVFLATVGQGEAGDLRSTTGTVTIESVSDRSAAGTFDIEVQSRNLLRTTQVRGRFAATWGDWLSAQLEHQAAIREKLRKRR